jgi:RNA polymerase sigma factor (sigma-70 family)
MAGSKEIPPGHGANAVDAGARVREAFDTRYQHLVAQLIAVTGSQHEAEEAVQEAFVRAMAEGRRWDKVEDPETWLRRTAVLATRSRWRRRVRRRLMPPVPGPAVPVDPTPERASVEAALDSLPAVERYVAVLYYGADLSVTAISRELDIPVDAARSLLSEARERLGPDLADRNEGDYV